MKNWRVNLIFILIFLFGAALIGRLFYIQINQHDLFKALSQGQQKIFSPIQSERGEVFFKNNQILATNIEEKFIYVSPREIEEKEKTAKTLSEIFNLDEDLILEKIKKDNLFEILKHKLTEEEAGFLEKLDLIGVYLGKEIKRNYPQEAFASQIIGFLSVDGGGQYGIESYYNEILEEKQGFQKKGKGPFGYLLSEEDKEDYDGSDIWLTLDYNVQFKAEKLLAQAKKNLNIESGQIIVINPNSGEIIALANFPNFNPNEYSKEKDLEIFQNSTIQKIFEPGSVFKPITMAIALEEGKITPKTTYQDKGFVKIGGYTIYNYDKRVWGEKTMTEVLEKSINTGAVFAKSQISHNVFLNYIEKFGFFEKTEIDLPAEISSQNQELKKGYEINFATASFGQGIEMTPIQLIRAYSVIANGGKLIKPYLVEKTQENGKITEIQPQIGDRVISQRITSQLTAMLVSVVKNGFAKSAQVPGYYVAGKTGTAQVSFSALGENKAGYSDKTVQAFIGFAPAFDPQFLILIKLDNPETKTAEYSAVPLFQELAKYIIDLWQIPPDYE